jgi:hypothetical protein
MRCFANGFALLFIGANFGCSGQSVDATKTKEAA